MATLAESGITIKIPTITAASIAPNPGVINAAVLISITATEISKILYPDPYYLGEIYAGEV